MNRNLAQVVIALLLLGAGLYVGRLVGVAEVYKKTAAILPGEHLREASVNLNSHLSLLELLRAKQDGQATAKLERMLDVDLRELSRFTKEDIKKQNPELPTLIDKAKQYRQQR
jgi:hypothetical protein